ncbi:MAG: hypothetical protein AAFN41_05660 [Planctomycetota bacterium]
MSRTGWMAGPVRPESGSIPEPFDPLRLGVLTYPLRWPRTTRLLATEFHLSRDQAWTVAWRARRHRGLRRGRAWVIFKFIVVLIAGSPVVAVFGALPAWEAFLDSTGRAADVQALRLWAIAFGVTLATIVLIAWIIYERLGMDRLIDRSIRDRWRDRVCLWCSQDMDDAEPHGDRWAVCPECGMRSPVAVRTP